MAITSDRDILRLKIGDTNEDSPLLFDEELDVFLAQEATADLALAAACETLATRFSRQVDFAEDGQSFRLGQRAAAYRLQAREIRQRVVGIISSPTTRVDGYSEDIAFDETDAGLRTGRVRRGYYDSDVPT